ncbi:hypothetical protein SJ2017_3010 [Shewanella japonica]|uniref:Uncharacterized protein n=1 Tax=Shewanella japonica TaxID=93973 RepID=A0ABN4YL29_9GAMM|nr:hypothetical protein SJ2017_3010 [Shewanella japonica]
MSILFKSNRPSLNTRRILYSPYKTLKRNKLILAISITYPKLKVFVGFKYCFYIYLIDFYCYFLLGDIFLGVDNLGLKC